MTKTEIINKLNEILENAYEAKKEADNAKDNASYINEDCSLRDVTYYAEMAESNADECYGYLEEVENELECLVSTLEDEDEIKTDTAIFDEMISELKTKTEEKLNLFEETLSAEERSLAELREEFNRLTEEIHNDLENLENEIKGDE